MFDCTSTKTKNKVFSDSVIPFLLKIQNFYQVSIDRIFGNNMMTPYYKDQSGKSVTLLPLNSEVLNEKFLEIFLETHDAQKIIVDRKYKK